MEIYTCEKILHRPLVVNTVVILHSQLCACQFAEAVVTCQGKTTSSSHNNCGLSGDLQRTYSYVNIYTYFFPISSDGLGQ